MKKLLVCAVLAALLPAALFAVDLSAGAKGGVNLGMFGGQDWRDALDSYNETNGMKLGLSGAAFLNIGLTDSLSIQPEVGYTMLGGKEKDSSMDFAGKYTINAIELPVLIMPKFAVGPGILSVFAGPDLFYLLGDMSAKLYIAGTLFAEGDVPIDNSLLMGFAAGVQYLYPISSGNIVFDAKYSQVLTEMFEGVEWYTSGINVRIGYAVQL